MKKLALFLSLGLFSMPALAAQAVSMSGLLNTVVYIVIIALIFWAIWWFVAYIGVPEPFNKIIKVVIGLAALIVVVSLLMGFIGQPVVKLT